MKISTFILIHWMTQLQNKNPMTGNFSPLQNLNNNLFSHLCFLFITRHYCHKSNCFLTVHLYESEKPGFKTFGKTKQVYQSEHHYPKNTSPKNSSRFHSSNSPLHMHYWFFSITMIFIHGFGFVFLKNYFYQLAQKINFM